MSEQEPEGYVIRCIGLAGRALTINGVPAPKGQFLESYDAEARRGMGFAEWTKDLGQAMVFVTSHAALKCWTQVPEARPTRADGKPNKPLTAFTVEVLTLADARKGVEPL